MDNRRLAIVVGLGVVELWVVGLMIRSLCGRSHDAGYSLAPAHVSAAAAVGAASAGRTAKTIETGPAPHVVIDDDQATLTVSVRPGTAVDVTEQIQFSGWMRGSGRPVTIEKTSDGVSITQPDSEDFIAFGSVRRRLDVVVPPGARLDVANAGSIKVSGLRAEATLHSGDGSIVVSDQRGALDVKTDDGRIELHDVEAPSVAVGSDNGRVTFDGVRADRVAISTDNGRIDVVRSVLRNGKIQTDNGRIRLALDPNSDVTVSAHTSSGKVVAEAPLTVVSGGDDDDAPSTIRVGNGAGRLEVGSDDGSITVAAGGV
jgi:hypothetical protein